MISRTTIGDIAFDLRSGFASGEDDPNGVIQFRMNNVERSGGINWDKLRRVPTSKVRDNLLVENGDILFNATNSPELVGKTALFSGFTEPVTFSNHFVRIRSRRSVAEPAYVARWLQREFERRRFASMCRAWVNQASITKDQLASLEIPLPPLAEQRRITALLDEVDALRRKRKRALEIIESLVGELVDAAYRNIDSMLLIGDLFDVQGGLQFSRSRSALPIEVPYLRVANVYRNHLDLSEIKTMRVTQAELDRTSLRKGDVLFVEGHGNANEIGRCAVWDGTVHPCVHQNHLIRARPNAPQLKPTILSRWLNSDIGRRYLLRRGKTTSGLNTITVSDVKATPIPIISPSTSERLSLQVEKLRQIAVVQSRQLREFEDLFSSLQHRAFSGQL